MRKEEIEAVFDGQAARYDKQWAGLAPINHGLHFLLSSMFAELPVDASILCVGAGTGAELVHLAKEHPSWTFTAVDPSARMLDVCRQRMEQEGFASRCTYHKAYVETLVDRADYDAATSFLVSQFFLQQEKRTAFFREIAKRLKPGGLLASSDLAGDMTSQNYQTLLHAWMSMMTQAGVPSAGRDRIRNAYGKDVAVLPAEVVGSIIEAGGFESPVPFFQAGLIHAWVSKRVSESFV